MRSRPRVEGKRAQEVLRRLKEMYPRPRITLAFKKPWESVVATILSAQCTDARVNIVTASLFKKYKTVRDYARAGQRALEADIHSTGFFRSKARHIIAAAQKVLKDFSGRVPDTMEGLLTLPGVARKTANVVLFDAFNKNEGIPVDTHVGRVSRRLGLSEHDDPDKIEEDLMVLLPSKEWGSLSLRLIAHGRRVCRALRPQCLSCGFKDICPSYRKA